MAFFVLQEYPLGTFILFGDESFHFVVDEFGCLLAIGFVPLLLAVIVAEVGQLVTHAGIGYHAIGLLGYTFEVIHGSSRDVSGEELFGCTSAEDGTHLVEHLLLGSDLSFFGQVPCGAERLSARHDGHLHQGVGILQVP